MIKPNDCRIGNHFRDKQSGTLLIVDEISKAGVTFNVADRKNFPLPEGWQAEPLPLTDKIILKAGFRQDSEFCFSSSLPIGNGSDIEMAFDPFFDEWEVTLKTEGEFNPESITFVHQLQNLWYTNTGGKELELKL